MARIAGVNIPQNKVVHVALTYIHGVGKKFSKDICTKLSISKSKRVNSLTDDEVLKIREFIGTLFRLFTNIFFGVQISDTQCGFKLYSSLEGKKVFNKIKTDGYMHDLEVYLIAKKMMIEIKELPVNWKHKPDGKIRFLKDFIKIFFSLILIKFYKY